MMNRVVGAPKNRQTNKMGFTVVELLIVIVVIAILAAVSVVGFSNVQAKARDSQRVNDIEAIAKALELYYVDNGRYPTSHCNSGGSPACPSPKNENDAWASTTDGSWNVLEWALVPKYMDQLPVDPKAEPQSHLGLWSGYHYEYVNYLPAACGLSHSRQMYTLYYRTEKLQPRRDLVGVCPGDSSVSNSMQYTGISSQRGIKS